jgi:hypothetical protein
MPAKNLNIHNLMLFDRALGYFFVLLFYALSCKALVEWMLGHLSPGLLCVCLLGALLLPVTYMVVMAIRWRVAEAPWGRGELSIVLCLMIAFALAPPLILVANRYGELQGVGLSFAQQRLSTPVAELAVSGREIMFCPAGKTQIHASSEDERSIYSKAASQGNGVFRVTSIECDGGGPCIQSDHLPWDFPASTSIEAPNWGEKFSSSASGSFFVDTFTVRGLVSCECEISKPAKARGYLMMPMIYPVGTGAGTFRNVISTVRSREVTVAMLPAHLEKSVQAVQKHLSSKFLQWVILGAVTGLLVSLWTGIWMALRPQRASWQ